MGSETDHLLRWDRSSNEAGWFCNPRQQLCPLCQLKLMCSRAKPEVGRAGSIIETKVLFFHTLSVFSLSYF
jgi:hypothetical protein